VSLLRSNVVRSLERVTNKEHGEVQADEIVVSVFGVELDGVASGVSRRVGVLSAIGDGGKSTEDWGLLADGGEEGCLGEVADVLGDDELSEGGPSSGVDDSFLDFGSVECLREMLVAPNRYFSIALTCCFSKSIVSPW
jgi:hypothetical protein